MNTFNVFVKDENSINVGVLRYVENYDSEMKTEDGICIYRINFENTNPNCMGIYINGIPEEIIGISLLGKYDRVKDTYDSLKSNDDDFIERKYEGSNVTITKVENEINIRILGNIDEFLNEDIRLIEDRHGKWKRRDSFTTYEVEPFPRH